MYLVRHGEIDKPAPRRFLGQTDLPLNANGVRQAQVLAEQLRPVAFSRVFTSPLQRAVQTAAIVSRQPAQNLTRIESFKEINLGAWEGLDVTEVEKRYPGAYRLRGQDLEHFRPEGGESFADLADRCFPAFTALASDHPGPLLVVAHAGVNRVILSRLLNRSLGELLHIPQEYCAINIIRFHGQQWRVQAINQQLGSQNSVSELNNNHGCTS